MWCWGRRFPAHEQHNREVRSQNSDADAPPRLLAQAQTLVDFAQVWVVAEVTPLRPAGLEPATKPL